MKDELPPLPEPDLRWISESVGPGQYTATQMREYARAALAMMVRSEVASHRLDGDHNIESPFNACMHKGYCLSLKTASLTRKPLSDEEIKRIPESIGMRVSHDRVTMRSVGQARGMTVKDGIAFARAVEFHHGIGEQE